MTNFNTKKLMKKCNDNFYLVVFLIYSLLSTLIIIQLSIQNNNLKNRVNTNSQDLSSSEMIELNKSESPRLGPSSAKVTVYAFMDTTCEFCASGWMVLKELQNKNPDSIRIIFKHLIINDNPNSLSKSKALVAANFQGKFWEMLDIGFENERKPGNDFESAIRYLEMDRELFYSDLVSDETDRVLEEGKALCKRLNIEAAPTFIINGSRVVGANVKILKEQILGQL